MAAGSPVWQQGLTQAQIDDFVRTYARARRTLGHDATHEAAAWTLHHGAPNLAAYFLVCAKAIAKAHYDDGGRGLAAFRTWARELPDLAPTDEPAALQWGSPVGRDPEDQAIARDELRRLPAWLIDKHLTTGFRVRKACWAHGPEQWVFHQTWSGGAVQCRRCEARRQRLLRERRRARHASDRVAAR